MPIIEDIAVLASLFTIVIMLTRLTIAVFFPDGIRHALKTLVIGMTTLREIKPSTGANRVRAPPLNR